jgi:hypothetical protein
MLAQERHQVTPRIAVAWIRIGSRIERGQPIGRSDTIPAELEEVLDRTAHREPDGQESCQEKQDRHDDRIDDAVHQKAELQPNAGLPGPVFVVATVLGLRRRRDAQPYRRVR